MNRCGWWRVCSTYSGKMNCICLALWKDNTYINYAIHILVMWCNYITTISTRGCAVVFPNHFSKRILCNTWKLLHSHLFCCESPPSCCVRTWSSVSPPSFLTDRRQPFEFCRRGSQSDRSSAHRGARPGLQFVEGEDRCRATVSTVVSLFTWVKSPPPSHQVNQSLSKLYVHVQVYRLYVGWLKEGQENASLSSKAAQHVNTHLRHLSDLLSSSLQQVRKQKQCRTLHKKDSPENKNKKMFVSILRLQSKYRVLLLWKRKYIMRLGRSAFRL